jgi:hypothetical protein
MEHVYHIDDDVFRQLDGPQGRDVVGPSNVYTILALLPVEADGRFDIGSRARKRILSGSRPRKRYAV